MKKIIILILVGIFFESLSGFDSYQSGNHYSKTQIEVFIREVFADQSEVLVFQSSSNRLALLTGFLDRFKISHHPEYAAKKFPLLSSVALLNKYNPNLSRDASFNPATFNPLKYRFPMTSKLKEIYRVDGTDFLLTIEPIL